MDNFKIIYRILRILEQSMDNEQVNIKDFSAEHLGISENRWCSIISMLVDNGYIEGVKIHRSADGYISLSINFPRITLKGLEYLEENGLMKKAYNLLKGIKDVTPGM